MRNVSLPYCKVFPFWLSSLDFLACFGYTHCYKSCETFRITIKTNRSLEDACKKMSPLRKKRRGSDERRFVLSTNDMSSVLMDITSFGLVSENQTTFLLFFHREVLPP